MSHRSTSSGFTLIEVLAVVFLTAILFGAAVTYYVELSSRSNRAADTTRRWRHATALLDRVAADLERAYLVKKLRPEDDPINHPFLFLAESRYAEEGADQLKFVSRRPLESATEGPRSDLSFVSYMLRSSDEWEDEYELVRWSAPGLPESLDREFPDPDDGQLLAEGIESFRLRFLDRQGSWHERWDSSQLEQSGTLPAAAEIEVSFVPLEGSEQRRVPPLSRRVRLPLPAIDLAALTDPEAYGGDEAREGGEDGEEGEDGDLMASECLDLDARNGSGLTVVDMIPGNDENVDQLVSRLDEIPWASAKSFIGGVSHPGILCD